MYPTALAVTPPENDLEPITVMGLDCGRPCPLCELTAAQRDMVLAADIVCAGRSLLRRLRAAVCGADVSAVHADGREEPAPSARMRWVPIEAPLAPLVQRLGRWRGAGRRVLVVTDGDPLLFGMGATLVREYGPSAVRLIPAVSALQQACARLGLPWHTVVCLSLHGRTGMHPLHVACGNNLPLCVLTDARTPPDAVARHLLYRGVDWFDAHVFGRMGAPDECVHHGSLAETAAQSFDAPCTLILTPARPPRRPCLGLEDAYFAKDGGCFTKQPVRASALSLLRLAPQHVVWDIGAGSGAVALEAAALVSAGRVVAVEQSPERIRILERHRRHFGAALVDIHPGTAPDCLDALPDPDRVFIGGGLSGAGGDALLEHVCRRLPPGGRVVASCVLLESLQRCQRCFTDGGWAVEMLHLAVSEGAPLGTGLHLTAHNPVFLVAAQKPSL